MSEQIREQIRVRIGIVGGKQVGKKSLVEEYICKYFNGTKESSESDKYKASIVTNVGTISTELSVIRDVKNSDLNGHDAFIIVSDVSDSNMHTIYIKWHSDLTYCLGHRIFIINCFNKTDISNVPTYVFESSAPAFDISVKTTSGINNMLTFVLRKITKRDNLLIFM